MNRIYLISITSKFALLIYYFHELFFSHTSPASGLIMHFIFTAESPYIRSHLNLFISPLRILVTHVWIDITLYSEEHECVELFYSVSER